MRFPSLYQFFRHQVQRGFDRHGLAEPATVEYVSDMLKRFAQTRALYAIHDQRGRSLDRIAELLAEYYGGGQPKDAVPDRHRQSTVARHIGEYALFMSGVFRERLRRRGELDYYVFNGRNAFRHCAYHELSPKRQQLFRLLGCRFGHIADALDHMVRAQFPLSPRSVTTHTFVESLWRL